MPAYVYRLWDRDDRLLYVGMTTRAPQRRIGGHLTGRWWGDTITRFTYDEHPDRAAALKAEANAILREQPRWNLDLNLGTFDSRTDWPLSRWFDVFTNLRNTAGEWGKQNKLSGWYDTLSGEFNALYRDRVAIVKAPGTRGGKFMDIPGMTVDDLLGAA